MHYINFESFRKLFFNYLSFLLILHGSAGYKSKWLKHANTKINTFVAVSSTKNVHPVFGPKRALWANGHELMSSYEYVLMRSCRKSRRACAHEQLWACAHTLIAQNCTRHDFESWTKSIRALMPCKMRSTMLNADAWATCELNAKVHLAASSLQSPSVVSIHDNYYRCHFKLYPYLYPF
jgi:hypothetical protein